MNAPDLTTKFQRSLVVTPKADKTPSLQLAWDRFKTEVGEMQIPREPNALRVADTSAAFFADAGELAKGIGDGLVDFLHVLKAKSVTAGNASVALRIQSRIAALGAEFLLLVCDLEYEAGLQSELAENWEEACAEIRARRG